MAAEITQVAVVTGAAGGIGSAVCAELARRGLKVCAVDCNADGLKTLQSALGTSLATFTCDVSSEQQVCSTVGEVETRYGRVDVLVNGAAILRDALLVSLGRGGLKKLSTELWRSVIETNLTGSFLMGREVAAIMVRRKIHGVIINVSSISRKGNIGQSSYAASKAAIDALVRTWSRDLALYKIRVAGISPGLIQTAMLDSIPPQQMAGYLERTPSRRLGLPAEIASGVGFILDNAFFNGRILEIDGGLDF